MADSGLYWLASYPKSGNTWVRIFLSNYIVDGDAPCDINQLAIQEIASSRVWVDDILGFDTADMTQAEVSLLRPDVYRWSTSERGVEAHKIHDAYTRSEDGRPLIDDQATLGALYIIRNPLDVAPSFAGHNGDGIDVTIDSMADSTFALASRDTGLTIQLRQFLGSWSDHVESWVDAPGLNCMTVRYEDLVADPHHWFGRIVPFLGHELDERRLEKAIAFSRFDILSEQEATNGFRERAPRSERFFRQGKAGSWRQTLTPAQVARIVRDHFAVMRRFGYVDADGTPL